MPPAARGPDMAVATAAAPVKAEEVAAAVETVLLEAMLPVPTATGLVVAAELEAATEVVVETTATAVEVDVPVVRTDEEEAGTALEDAGAAVEDGAGRTMDTPACWQSS